MTKREIDKQVRAYKKMVKDLAKPAISYTHMLSDDESVRADCKVTIAWLEDDYPSIRYQITRFTWNGYKIRANEDDLVHILEGSPDMVAWEKRAKKLVKDTIKEIDKFCKKHKIDPQEIYK